MVKNQVKEVEEKDIFEEYEESEEKETTETKGIHRTSCVFYEGFYKSISKYHGEVFEDCVRAFFDYALLGKERNVDGVAKMFFDMAKDQIDANNKKYLNSLKAKNKRCSGNKACDDKKSEINLSDEQQENSGETCTFSKTKASRNQTEANRNQTEANRNQTEASRNQIEASRNQTEANRNQIEANVYDNDNVNVNENENVNENVSVNENVMHEGVTNKNSAETAEPTHPHGEYNNVLLTDAQYQRLVEEKGGELAEGLISTLSRYMAEKGDYKSKCHFETLRNPWVKERYEKQLGAEENSRYKTSGEVRVPIPDCLKAEGFDIDLEDIFERPTPKKR